MINGTVNWMSETDKPKEKRKQSVTKKESVFTDAKKLKAIEGLLKKVSSLETDVNELYNQWPTCEMSTIVTLIDSIRFNIKKVKPVKE